MAFYQEFQRCPVSNAALLGDGICHNIGKYNTAGCGFDNGDCLEFNQDYPGCKAQYTDLLADGRCDGGVYNTLECLFDGGDCDVFNSEFPECNATYPIRIGNGYCDEEYNTAGCGYDGADCLDLYSQLYPNCIVDDLSFLGDGDCHGGAYNTPECGFDHGDCQEFNWNYPNCIVDTPTFVGDELCDGGDYNTPECLFDGGDCADLNQYYPNCTVDTPSQIGSGYCSGGEYNTEACGFDGGDCTDFNIIYPNCTVDTPFFVGDGWCDGGDYNTLECLFDGGDCADHNQYYPNCNVSSAGSIGDSWCDGDEHNTEACGFDGGDCADFNQLSNCIVDDPRVIGDGKCDGGEYNTEACRFDGGDCAFANQHPNCTVDVPSFLGNGDCDAGEYNTAECGFDRGDCTDFNSDYPNCTVIYPYMIGNGVCNGYEYHTKACGFDGGDCKNITSKYPNCIVDDPSAIGNGDCDGGKYNTEACEFDGGDCADHNNRYPNCTVDKPDWIGNGVCDYGAYNSEECGFDEDDCEIFNTNYPNCPVDEPFRLGDGRCDGGTYNSAGCLFDDADCASFNYLYPACLVDEPFRVGDGHCDDDAYNSTECQFDGGDCLVLENIDAVMLVDGRLVSTSDYQRQTRTYAIVQTVSSMLSCIASIAIIWIIFRSHEELSTIFHRLLFGLCVADIISSFAQSFSTLPSPDTYADVIWNARGDIASCRAQGFFIFLGSIAGPLYNCSMCFYYLVVVKYNWKDEYIETKIEPFLHAVPIAISMIGAITILAMNAFNPNMTYCFIGPDPTCDEFECDGTRTNAKVLFSVFSAGPYIVLPSVIAATMAIMYQSLLAQEKKLKNYGKAALLANINAKAREQEDDASNRPSLADRFKSCWKKKSKTDRRKGLKKTSSTKKQLRIIADKALAYSLAFFFTYLVPMIISIRTLIGYPSGPALSVIARVLFPLQGFFNFVVFIHPKVTHEHAKRENAGISWLGAFVKAVQARGPRQKRLVIYSPMKKARESLVHFLAKRKTPKTKKMKRSAEVGEEKCEIVPSPQSSLQTLSTNKSSSMYASNMSLGGFKSSSQQQYSAVDRKEKKRIVTFSDSHASSEATYQTPLKHVSNEGQPQFEDEENGSSGQKEEEKFQFAASQPNSSHTTHQNSPSITSNSPGEVEEEKCEIVPVLQTPTINQRSSMYSSNMPLGDAEDGGSPQQQYSKRNEEKLQVSFSDEHDSTGTAYQSPLNHGSNEGQMQFEDAENGPSGQKEEAK